MFIDDNSDNAFGVYMAFAHPELQRLEEHDLKSRETPDEPPPTPSGPVDEDGVVMHSCWLPPPPSGKVTILDLFDV